MRLVIAAGGLTPPCVLMFGINSASSENFPRSPVRTAIRESAAVASAAIAVDFGFTPVSVNALPRLSELSVTATRSSSLSTALGSATKTLSAGLLARLRNKSLLM